MPLSSEFETYDKVKNVALEAGEKSSKRSEVCSRRSLGSVVLAGQHCSLIQAKLLKMFLVVLSWLAGQPYLPELAADALELGRLVGVSSPQRRLQRKGQCLSA